MIKFALASDLHNEFYKNPPELAQVDADILVLAGDIQTPNFHDDAWWKKIAKDYEYVIYIRGNHEYYHTYYSQYPKLDFPLNVIPIGKQPQIISLKGVKILAGTMWTDLSNPLHYWTAKACMNDYKFIKYSSKRTKFTPDDTQVEFLSFNLLLKEEKPEIVISHHLPSFSSVNERYMRDDLNCAYASELDIDGVKLWMHGHTHMPCDYMKQGCRVVCNPKGYPGEFSDRSLYKPIILES